jgi:GNAT superfamily N-acetyltransferase
MSPNIIVVEAIESDLPAIIVLLEELSANLERSHDLDQRQLMANCQAILHDDRAHILLAKDGADTLGLIEFSTRTTALHPAPSALIDELIVAEQHRGKGIGGELIRAAIEICQRMGCCEIEVSLESGNRKARDFYRKRGFEEDAVLLEMDLE